MISHTSELTSRIDDVLMYNEAARQRIEEIVRELRRDEGVMISIVDELRAVYEIILRAESAARGER